ncbi:hypothetical protein [Streptomyces sp. AC550_RSS872]|nr:hypothetical protein [Streptomyces sp. AC550_RSS872]
MVVHPPALDGSRRVTEGDETLGVAAHMDDGRRDPAPGPEEP